MCRAAAPGGLNAEETSGELLLSESLQIRKGRNVREKIKRHAVVPVLGISLMLVGFTPAAGAEPSKVAPAQTAGCTPGILSSALADASCDGNLERLETPGSMLPQHVYSEGYVLCADGVYAADIGYGGTGFSASTDSVRQPLPDSTRFTPPGTGFFNKLRLEQTWQTSGTSATVTMTVKNVTNSPITGVVLRRYADLDVDGSAGSNTWTTSPGTVTATDVNTVTMKDWSGGGVAAITDYFDESCAPATYPSPTVGDHAGSISYAIGTLAPAGSSTQIKVRYTT